MAKTVQDIRTEFNKRGVSIAAWAEHHQFSQVLVYAVLRGDRKCLRGQSHRIAVALGLKEDLGYSKSKHESCF